MVNAMKHKIYKIKWADSANYREWYNFEELHKLSETDQHVISIGRIVFEDDKCIILAMNIDSTSCSGITKIPKVAILSRKEIKI